MAGTHNGSRVSREKDVRQCAKEHPDWTRVQIAKKLKCSVGTVHKYLGPQAPARQKKKKRRSKTTAKKRRTAAMASNNQMDRTAILQTVKGITDGWQIDGLEAAKTLVLDFDRDQAHALIDLAAVRDALTPCRTIHLR